MLAERLGAADELSGRKSDDNACNDQTREILKDLSQKPFPGTRRGSSTRQIVAHAVLRPNRQTSP